MERRVVVTGLGALTPIGNNVKKNVSEDIVIPPNGVYYIEKIDFNYKRSTEIYRS